MIHQVGIFSVCFGLALMSIVFVMLIARRKYQTTRGALRYRNLSLLGGALFSIGMAVLL